MKIVMSIVVVVWCCAAEEQAVSQTRQQSVGRLLQDVLAGEPLPADVVYVHVSDEALRRLVSRPVVQQASVSETIVGTPVRGISNTVGQTDVRLVPAKDRAVIDLVFTGQIQAQTTGFGGPVRVQSASSTRFSATKRLVLDGQGIKMLPARVAARTSISIEGVTTDLPGLRGRIVQRVGSRRAMESRWAAEAESARKAEIRIAEQLDREVAKNLRDAQSRLSQFLVALRNGDKGLRGELRFATSGRHLQVTIDRGTGDPSHRGPPSLALLGSPDLAIHAHSSLVQRVMRSTILNGEVDPLVTNLLADESPQYVSLVPGKPRTPHTQLKQSVDGRWWSLLILEVKGEM